jgi:hypothetical protein
VVGGAVGIGVGEATGAPHAGRTSAKTRIPTRAVRFIALLLCL